MGAAQCSERGKSASIVGLRNDSTIAARGTTSCNEPSDTALVEDSDVEQDHVEPHLSLAVLSCLQHCNGSLGFDNSTSDDTDGR